MSLLKMTEDENKNLREYLMIEISHRILLYGEGSVLAVECKKCNHRTPINISKPTACDSIVDFIMEIKENSEAVKIALLSAMREKLDDIAPPQRGGQK